MHGCSELAYNTAPATVRLKNKRPIGVYVQWNKCPHTEEYVHKASIQSEPCQAAPPEAPAPPVSEPATLALDVAASKSGLPKPPPLENVVAVKAGMPKPTLLAAKVPGVVCKGWVQETGNTIVP